MRTVWIVGQPSGGTSVTSGTLMHNGYYCGLKLNRYYENLDLRRLFQPYHDGDSRQKPATSKAPGDILDSTLPSYFEQAYVNGYERACLKMPGISIYHAHLVDVYDFQPLIVLRDLDEVKESVARRKQRRFFAPYYEPEAMHDALLKLIDERPDWPVWHFSRQAKHEELEEAIGHELPYKLFDPERIRSCA